MKSWPEQLTIEPMAKPFQATVTIPGSKSLTNRALVMAALAEEKSHLHGILRAEDTEVMLAGLGELGLHIEHPSETEAVVAGCKGRWPAESADLFFGNSGTTTRFLTAALTLGSDDGVGAPAPRAGRYAVRGIERMHERPIYELVEPLRHLGADIEYSQEKGYPPLIVNAAAAGIAGGEITLKPTLSSQFISALCMAAPYFDQGLTIHFDGPVTSSPYVIMTLRQMQMFGAAVEYDDALTQIRIKPSGYRGIEHDIEPDASNASYFLAAGALIAGSSVTVPGLNSDALQGDVGCARVLEQMGAQVDIDESAKTITVSAPAAGQSLQAVDVDLNAMPDLAQTLACVAVFAEGTTHLRNIGNLRVKETDRMAAIENELTKVGATVVIKGDDLSITPPASADAFQAATIETYDDHRMAMSFSLIGLRVPGITIDDPKCVKKTFPTYFELLDSLR